MILQLNPPLPLEIAGKGWGWAQLATWNHLEQSIYWTVFMEDGSIWTLPNEKARAMKNITGERYEHPKF